MTALDSLRPRSEHPPKGCPAGRRPVQGFIGEGSRPQQVQTLASMGISIVVDARGGSRESEKEAVTRLGMEYV
jgi:hypothetical protein